MPHLFVLCLLGLAAPAAAHEPSPVAEAIAGTLLSSVGVMMMLYYLMNWPDVEVRMYTNRTVSLTIAIFIAVLIYQFLKELLVKFTLAHTHAQLIALCIIHRLFWHVFLEAALRFICRERKGAPSEKATKRTRVNATCWGTLMAHLGGFASIGIWTEVQQLPAFGSNPITGAYNPAVGLLVVPVAAFFESCLFASTRRLREALLGERQDKHCDHHDESSQHHAQHEELEKIWEEALEEAEQDAKGLIYSFVLVLSIRFWIKGGVLEGMEEIEAHVLQAPHKATLAAEMYGFGLACLVTYSLLETVTEWFRSHKVLSGGWVDGQGLDQSVRTLKQTGTSGTCLETEWKFSVSGSKVTILGFEPEEAVTGHTTGSLGSYTIHWSNGWVYRQETVAHGVFPGWLLLLRGVLGMCVGWSFLFATQWLVAHLVATENPTLLAAMVAVCLSVAGFGSIYVLDKLADAAGPWSAEVEALLYIVVDTIPLGVGFSWERIFDNSIEVLAEMTRAPLMAGLPLTLFCVLLIIPSWRMYILPTIVHGHWHFGFDPNSAIENVDFSSKESVSRYIELLKHIGTLGEHEVDPRAKAGLVRAASHIGDLEHLQEKGRGDTETQLRVYRMILEALENTAQVVKQKIHRSGTIADLSEPLLGHSFEGTAKIQF